MRYFLDLSYRGTSFHGWQVQPNANTVQAEIHKAMQIILQQRTECVGSGRTDTGVHAIQQVVHLDADLGMDPEQFLFKMNTLLPIDIAINAIRAVHQEAHARFDAVSRNYQYHIHCRKNPFKNGLSYHFTSPLQIKLIDAACSIIKVQKNFQAFSKVHTNVKHFDCDIKDIQWEETNEGYAFSVSANRFLRGMVRAMVGTLLDIGMEKMTLSEFERAIASGSRSALGRSVPPEGLFLAGVVYPESIYN